MKERYSILRPLTAEEQELFAALMCSFFSPLNYQKNCEALGAKSEQNVIKPLSFGDFLRYLKKMIDADAYKYTLQLTSMLQAFINRGLFVFAGYSKGSPPYSNCYYAHFELTEVQKTNHFWLGSILGVKFLMEKFKPFIVRFEGIYDNNISGTGSGILINSDTILTCKHNLTDLKEYQCYAMDKKLDVSRKAICHSIHDIGILKLNSKLSNGFFPYFGIPYILDDTLTMGYPPLRGMRDPALISQKGEVNAISKDWQNCDCITISSTVRPGNSGGPVISKRGYIIGIVTQFANSASSVSVSKEDFKDDKSIPFYNAISSTSIRDILAELDDSIKIIFENYQ